MAKAPRRDVGKGAGGTIPRAALMDCIGNTRFPFHLGYDFGWFLYASHDF